jgi:hypothetical protein
LSLLKFSYSDWPIKAVIRHLPGNTPAEDIAKELQALGFIVISVRQLTSKRPQAPVSLPLFLITLPRSDKSQEIFQLTSLSHVMVKVEAYRAQTGLTQCYNCQQFGHIWANCKQPPKCVWCGGGHIHQECPGKEKRGSTPACCNCKLTEREKPHPSIYRGCKLAKEEMQNRRAQKLQAKEPAGRVFSTRLVTPTVSFAEAVRTAGHNRPCSTRPQQTIGGGGKEKTDKPNKEKERDLSGQTAGNNHTSSLDNMFKVVTVAQQIMTGLNECVRRRQNHGHHKNSDETTQ